MKKAKVTILLAITALALAGCKPSKEKLAEAEKARQELVEAQNNAENTYLDITDSSKKEKLDELASKVDEVEAVDFSKMSDKKIDEYLPQVSELTDDYNNIQDYLDGTLKSETEAATEAAKNLQIDAYIINKTGMNLKEIKLHDLTKDSFSDNLMGDDVMLQAGYTLMGVELQIRSDSSSWEIVVKNENDTSYTLPCDNLLDKVKDGVSLTLLYDEETQTGSVNMGSYIGIGLPVEESAAAASSAESE